MTKIKLCGNFRLADVAALNAAKPDYAGVIFVPNRRRSITSELAQKIWAELDPTIPLVGVFQGQTLAQIIDLFQQGVIQLAQLQAGYQQTDVLALQNAGVPVIFVSETPVQTTAEWLLFDQGQGGTGQTLDWAQLPQVARQFGLAGGLNAGNLAQAIAQVQPDLVDISSGSEVDGFKNVTVMTELVRIAHAGE